MLNVISKDKLINSVFLLPLAWMATGMLWDGDGDMRLVPIVLFSMIVSIMLFKFDCIVFNFRRNPWIKLLILSSLFGTVAYMTYGFDSRELRATLIVFFLLLILPRGLFSKRYLQCFLLLSSISCALYGYKYQFLTELERGQWPINAIPYATICGLLLITSVGLLITKYRGKSQSFLCISALFSMMGIIFSQSRGPLISVSIVIILIVFFIYSFRSKSSLFYSLSLMLIFSFFILQTSLVSERVEQTYTEYKTIKEGELNSSIGVRLYMYGVAVELWDEKPILGYGKEVIKERFKEMENEGIINTSVNRLLSMTFHNGYLDKFVIYGLGGGFIFLLILFYPINLSFSYTSEQGNDLLWAPAVFIIICNMVDTPFINAQATIYYMFLIGYIYMMLSEEKRALNS